MKMFEMPTITVVAFTVEDIMNESGNWNEGSPGYDD